MMSLAPAWRQASARDRRAVALGLVVVAAAFVVLRIVPWTVGRTRELSDRARGAQAALTSAQAVLAETPAARESLAARAQRLVGWAPRLFGGNSSGEAQADFATWVTGLAVQRQVRVLRQDVGRDSTASLFTQLTLHIEAEGDVRGVTAWLGALESGQRLVQVRALRLDAPEAANPDARRERLHVEVVLVGWAMERRKGAPS